MYRFAAEEDFPAIVQLWQAVFGDDEEYIARCLAGFAGVGNIYLAEGERGAMEAFMLAVPCRVRFTQGVYLYALATHPKARRTGVMSGLMTFAERRSAALGAQFAVLIPARPELFGYYLKRGYTQDILLRHLTKTVQPGVVGLVDHTRPSPEEFLRLREQHFDLPCLAFTVQRQALVLEDVYASGGHVARTMEGYAVFFPQDEQLLVAELCAQGDADAENLLCALAEKTGVGSVQLTLPVGEGPFEGQGMIRPAALMKPLDHAYPYKEIYMRFAMDVVPDSF
ncbi:MAG: GNAT family N-acetyltransferase [Oscillospiraceae bacterium]